MKYRKKPVVIEAYKYQAELGNNRLMNWLAQQEANVKERMATVAEDKVEVERDRLALMAIQHRDEKNRKDSERNS